MAITDGNMTVTDGNMTVTNGDLDIIDENSNSVLTTVLLSEPTLVATRASSSYDTSTYSYTNATDDNNATKWSSGSNDGAVNLASDRGTLTSGYFYDANGVARTASNSAYTYYFYLFGQTVNTGHDNVDYGYGEWLQLEYSIPCIFKNF